MTTGTHFRPHYLLISVERPQIGMARVMTSKSKTLPHCLVISAEPRPTGVVTATRINHKEYYKDRRRYLLDRSDPTNSHYHTTHQRI